MTADSAPKVATSSTLLEQAAAYRARAAQMKESAATLRSDQARTSMLDIASSYEFLADTCERQAGGVSLDIQS